MRIDEEMSGAEFGDARLTKRMKTIVRQLADAPAQSLPKATVDDASLEATYRFLNNETVEPARILAPHYRATVARCAQSPAVIVAHDTTELRFSGERTELGRLSTKDYGFLAHVALAMDLRRTPLGVIGLQTWFRDHAPHENRHSERRPAEERESYRWQELVTAVEERLSNSGPLLHVMDREADFYELLCFLTSRRHRFVVRLRVDRTTEKGSISAELNDTPSRCTRTAEISSRPVAKQPGKARKHPSRAARIAQLEVCAKTISVQRPSHVSKQLPDCIALNVVRVFEPSPPEGCEAVNWILLTTEPIETDDELSAIIDAYRARWVIEEYFKSLKTGCAFEKRQLENRAALLNALALYAPIAWRLLLLRSEARESAQRPAIDVLTPLQLRILRNHQSTKLVANATVLQAMMAIARLGGHIKNNGAPGWQVLGRGFDDLLMMERGAALMM